MMHSRRARAAGRDDQHADVTPDDAHATPTTPEEGRENLELAELEADNDEVRRAAESLERRRHDLHLRNELAAEQFDGPAWDRFAEELARYGHAVMLAWLRTGAIFGQCKRKNRPIGTAPTTWSDEDRIDLATDAVVSAIKTFREKSLIAGGWTFEGGASLRTFFIGACVLVFPAIYRVWKNNHLEQLRLRGVGTSTDLDAFGDPLVQPVSDPGAATARWHEISDGLRALPDDRTRTAVAATTLGYSYDEVAELISVDEEITRNNVAQILYRHRRRLEKGAST